MTDNRSNSYIELSTQKQMLKHLLWEFFLRKNSLQSLQMVMIAYSFLFFSLILFSCNAKAPVITSIDPKIGRMGEVITLRGENFGDERAESFITIAGITPTSSSYFAWEDDMIMVRVPENGESGLIYVHVRGRRSNGVLFSAVEFVPRPVEGEHFGLEPRITQVIPQTGAPGSLITINGANFGASREISSNGGVFFSWDFDAPSFNQHILREPEFIEVSDNEFGYEFWSPREIRARVPDGAVSGNLKIVTNNGESRPVLFDVSGKPGNKNLTDKRSYTISYSVDIRILEATRPNSLYLWMPIPITSPSQRNTQLISRNIEPFIENHRGLSLFKLDNLASGSNHSVKLSVNVEVYAIETEMRPASIRQESSPLTAAYTQSSELIPSNNAQIRSTANAIIAREQNPYLGARLIYDWILTNMQITESMSNPAATVVTALEQRQADPYHAALLFASLARAARIPCIPVAGVIINRNGQTHRHYWVEFWIDGFGWVPVDPAMGANAVPDSFITKEDSANFYFGNLDNQRIAFSRGELVLSQMERHGRLVSHTQSYSLQNIWEEAAGGLESYSSLWGDIVISGVY